MSNPNIVSARSPGQSTLIDLGMLEPDDLEGSEVDDEDEVIFDQAHLLAISHSSNASGYRDLKWRKKFGKTMILCAAFAGLGVCVALVGPTLPDLQLQIHTDIKHITRVFTGRSAGYVVGSIITGILFAYFNQEFILSLICLMTSIATALIPTAPSLTLMASAFFMQGIAMGTLDTGGNVMCLEIWKADNGPYLQALHFAFGFGAFLAPFVASPFISPVEYDTNNTTIPTLLPTTAFITSTASVSPHHVEKREKLLLDSLQFVDNSSMSYDSTSSLPSSTTFQPVTSTFSSSAASQLMNYTVKSSTDTVPKKPAFSGKHLNQKQPDENRIWKDPDQPKDPTEAEIIEEMSKESEVNSGDSGCNNMNSTECLTNKRLNNGTDSHDHAKLTHSSVSSSTPPISLLSLPTSPPTSSSSMISLTTSSSSPITPSKSPTSSSFITSSPITPSISSTSPTTSSSSPITPSTSSTSPVTSLTSPQSPESPSNHSSTTTAPSAPPLNSSNSSTFSPPAYATTPPATISIISLQPTTFSSTTSNSSGSFNEFFAPFTHLQPIFIPYLFTALWLLICSLLYISSCCLGPRTCRSVSHNNNGINTKPNTDDDDEDLFDNYRHRRRRYFKWSFVITMSLFYFTYVGLEVTYGALIYSYALHTPSLHFTSHRAALLTSTFWGSFAMSRGLAIVAARFMSPFAMLITDQILIVTSAVVLTLWGAGVETVLWVATATLGMGQASVFPAGFSYTENYINVTSFIAALFVLFAASGEMAMPWLIGHYFLTIGPQMLMYVQLTLSLVNTALFIFAHYIASHYLERTSTSYTTLTLSQFGSTEGRSDSTILYDNPVDETDGSEDARWWRNGSRGINNKDESQLLLGNGNVPNSEKEESVLL